MVRDQQGSLADDEDMGDELALHPESRGGSTELLVLAAASVLLVAGVSMILLPTIAPQYGWVLASLARRGVTSLPMIVGGVILYGTWVSGRASRARSQALQEATRGSDPAIQKLAEEVAHLGDGLQGLRIEFVYLKDALHTQQERSQQNPSADVPADGMFRLAASLDQVGYRIEERLAANHLEVSHAVQALAGAVETLRSVSASARIQVAAETEARASAPRRLDPEVDSAAAIAREAADAWASDESGRRARLGLLDMLDDLGRLLPRKTSPALERPNLQSDPFEDAQDEGWKHSGILPGPLPSRSDDLRVPGPGALLGGGFGRAAGADDEAPLGDKLSELRSLLSDERVRDALASIEQRRR